ncbi:protein phosphatase 2C-like domain-containing protein 1 [Orycteropus afer afer]|uniref:Protein phosphatase 2C-like domain-containing protein 1 n=1 Tax=Orycteropus afer afer TaxID=1230840 RepID=A0A8B6ZND5_ORYAF|nr:protein phosphatase 2C-like domain-containing protein 1 [Orycteropus afer afer]
MPTPTVFQNHKGISDEVPVDVINIPYKEFYHQVSGPTTTVTTTSAITTTSTTAIATISTGPSSPPPEPQPSPLSKLEEQNLGKREQDEKETDQLPKSMETNAALKVFWKSKEWKMRVSTFDSDEAVSHQSKKIYRNIKKKKKRSLEITEDYDEQQASKQVVTFPCSICKHEIDLPSFFFHKKQHKALTSLGFHWMGGKKPEQSEIVAQRQFLITKLLSSFIFSEKVLQSINNAFELIWKKHLPAYYKIIDNIDRSSIYSQKIRHLLIKGVAICEDRNSMWRTTMDDKFTIVNNFGNKPNVCFFGLFDGHYGASAANLASMELPILLLHQISRFDPSYQMTPEEQNVINSFHTVFKEEYRKIEDHFSFTPQTTKTLHCEFDGIHKAFAKAFWRMDRLLRLGRKEVSRVRWSGCSAVTCILEGNIKNVHANNDERRKHDHGGLTDSSSFTNIAQIVSGVLHVANTGNVHAVLCRNGKGFCLTKEHTMQNVMERRRVLQNGAIIDANEPNGLLEGQTKTTRGLGFHGNLKLKKFMIPAPQTISVPIDDLCQFLILATNGLWEVLDKKEVTALAMTIFHMYTEKHSSITQNNSSPGKLSEPSIMKSESSIHILYQDNSLSKECMLATKTKENVCDSKSSKHSTLNLENSEKFPPNMTNHAPYSGEKTNGPGSVDGVPTDPNEKEKEPHTEHFYEGAAKYVSHELVNAALAAGSRDNITVMVVLLNGSDYHFLI